MRFFLHMFYYFQDLGEYGIAPRVIKATEEFRTGQQQTTKRPFVSDGLIPGEAPLASLIKPARYLLQQMFVEVFSVKSSDYKLYVLFMEKRTSRSFHI